MLKLGFGKPIPLDKKILLRAKIILALAIVSTGIIIIGIGSDNFLKEPFLKTNLHFSGEFDEDDKKYIVGMNFHGPIGLVPYRGIDPYISVTFPETTTNSSKVELLFLNGRVMNPNDNPAQTREGKPVQFAFDDIAVEGSRYIATPYLIYYSVGPHGAVVNIELKEGQIIEHEFENVIELDSWELYLAEKGRMDSIGIAWLLIGIALITTAPTFTKILDWAYEYDKLKKSGA